jgi:hypothetical protein
MKIAIKDSFGRWKENTYMQKIPNACSSMKKLLGNGWTTFVNSAGSQNTICPILPVKKLIFNRIPYSIIIIIIIKI